MDMVKTHAAANAKAKAMLGKLLKDKDYVELTKLDTVDEVLEYLNANTHYSNLFDDMDVSSESIEILIKRHFFTAYEKLFHFYIDEYRDFFKALFTRYEVENLKLFLRAVSRKENLNSISNHLIYSNLYSNINYDTLNQVTTIRELLDAIKETKYYAMLEPFSDEEPASMVFHMEMVLDRAYFNQLYETIMALSRTDRKLMLELLGINVDILNIQWIYRGRKYFDITSEELFNFTLNGGKLFDYKELKRFCYMDLNDFKLFILQSEYKTIFQDKEFMMERAMERHLYYKLNDFTKNNGLSIALPVVLLFKFEYEIRDLFTIMEGHKYHFEELNNLLIRDLRRER